MCDCTDHKDEIPAYDAQAIESRWMKAWEDSNLFAVDTDDSKPKKYVLEMFPYPSGDLHMGHARNYTIGDAMARQARMRGYDVLHPIGFDAFGLPAENAAIKHNTQAAAWTYKNMDQALATMKRMGISYDLDRMVKTCSPDYYRWGQWIFEKMWEKGLVYRKKNPVNWCPTCKTVLANEQVTEGKCWRCGTEPEKRDLEQWYYKITEYSQELLDDLEKLPGWPERVKQMQANWIGRSEGAEVDFTLCDQDGVPIEGDEGKISSALARLMEEDPTLSYVNNAETHQQIIGGLGEQHLDVVKAKLKNKFGVEIGLEAPRIAYRESIRKACQKQGRHKKQTGGHGQFGDVVINFEPCDSEQVVFEEKVFGGSVPKNFFPAVEKGVRLAAEKGVLAGYPVVGLKATLLDGSYHPVDSSEMAFIMAAKLAYKAAMPEAGPVILEPIHTLKAHVPNDNTGDIMGDVTKRRGRVLGMEPDEDGMQTVIAEVPLAELSNFTTFIRQITQGRGWFTTEFARYEVLPEMLVPAVVEQAKKLGNLDESADD